MGKIKYLPEVKEFIKKTPAFLARDIELIVKNKRYAHLLLHNLGKKEEIYRLTKGCYSKAPDPILAVFCFKPAYLGLQEALSLHDLWEQETNPVIITPRRVREGVRQVLGNNIVIYRISPRYFFGFEFLRCEDVFLPVSDIEKTLVDLIYFKNFPSEKTLREIKKRIKPEKLNSYLKHYPQDFRLAIRKTISGKIEEK